MNVDLILTCLFLCLMFGILLKDRMRPGFTLFTIVILMLATGIITTEEAISGFSNPGMITIGLLFLVSEGVSRSGALRRTAKWMFPQKQAKISAHLAQILIPTSAFSAFLNNTPIVIIFAPLLKNWGESMGISSQKLLIPLSYATILGGMCTVIGTTTNLLIDGMMRAETGQDMGLFEIGKVGLPLALVGLCYIIFASRYLLPGPKIQQHANPFNKEYYYDVYLPAESQLIGCSTSEIPGLSDFKVVALRRVNQELDFKKHPQVLQAGDCLLLEGGSQSLQKILYNKSLSLTCLDHSDEVFQREASTQVEAVLAPRFPGIGKTLLEFDFFRHYGATVMAIHRNGQRISEGIDLFRLEEGDNLVLLTDDRFMQTWGESSVFYLLSETGEVNVRVDSRKRYTALALLLFMIVGATLKDKVVLPYGIELNMLTMAAITAVAMAWLDIFPAKKYTKFVSWDVMITIASALAISKGITNSGLASYIAQEALQSVFHLGPHALLAVLFIITIVFTEFITNTAAAAIVFPIALELARHIEVNPMPFFIAICIASSASFLTPIGYQTNLIVQGIGNYKFIDFFKVGLPLTVICFIISMLLIPYFFPF